MNLKFEFPRRIIALAGLLLATPGMTRADIIYGIPNFATGPGAAGKAYDPALVTIVDHAGVTGTTAAQLLTLQTLNVNAGTAISAPRFQNNTVADVNQTLGSLVTDVGTANVSYFQFGTVSTAPGGIYLNSLSFDARRATGGAGVDRKYTVQISTNGGAFTTLANQVIVTAYRGSTPGADNVNIPLIGPVYQGLNSVDFRVFSSGAGALEYSNIAINGTVGSGTPLVFLSSSKINRTGGTFQVTEQNGASVNAAGVTLVLTANSTPVPATVSATKTGAVTTVNFTASIQPNTTYSYTLTVPKTTGTPDVFTGTLKSFVLPGTLDGIAGSVGTWGIREYTAVGATNIVNSLGVIASNPTMVEATAPVFNHSDPDTNNATTSGNFNNDLPILSNTPGNQDIVVVGKTKVTVAAAGDYTFSVHSDDGFAMRVSGAGGGRFVSSSGVGAIDAGDNQTIYFDGATGDSSTRGVYHFDAAGTYDILYLGFDGSGGVFYEVAWAAGVFTDDKNTNTWSLVGTPSSLATTFRPRFLTTVPGPAASAQNYGIRTFLGATGITTTGQASDFLRTTLRLPEDADGLTIDSLSPTLNFTDPEGVGPVGFITPDLPFPGNTPVADDNVVTAAKGRITISTAGFYTFGYQGDDGFLFRIKATGGLPNPGFKRVIGAGGFEMSNQNEMFGGLGESRGIIYLLAGNYDVEFIHFEVTGGFSYELTSSAGEWPTGTPTGGWKLLGPSGETLPFVVSGFTTSGSPAGSASFTFSSANAGTYGVQVSTDLITWSPLTATITDNGNGTSSVNANFTGQTVNGQAIVGQPKLFIRVVRTF